MTRRRLRPAHTPDDLAQLYATPHDHRRWADHHLRVDVTIQVGRWLAASGVAGYLDSAADLSCGNGTILEAIPAPRKVFGDFAPGYEHTGPIEETIGRIGQVGLFVCSETLEHLDDPDKVLKAIRERARLLLLSTPIGEDDDNNPEHYWGWDVEDVGQMLAAAGWQTVTQVDVKLPGWTYDYQIWACR